MKAYHIAVLDIGKTHKKLLVYSSELDLTEEKITKIPEIEKDGIQYDDVEKLKAWILSTLSELSGKYDIKVICTSAHGAAYSFIDDLGNSVVPQIAYTTDPGEDLHRQFYELCGDPVQLQKNTATPNFNLLINPAKGIFFTQRKFPEQCANAGHIVLYAQFFSSWLTGKVCYDPTYAGNHTYLWDFSKMDWSNVSDKLGIRHLLPKEMKNPWDAVGRIKNELAKVTGLSKETLVTAGIHDSNASMLPYLISSKEPFILNSTGTWCVIMNEKEEVKFEKDELGKVVFYNLNAFKKPVKTAIFLGGMEFEFYAGLLQKIHGRRDFPRFNEELVQQIIAEKKKFILPSIAKGIGQFPDSDARIIEGESVFRPDDIELAGDLPDFFGNYEEALAVLNLALAIQTKVSFVRAGFTEGTEVFTEGGFSKNDTYNTLMTSFFPTSDFFLTNLQQASAFGAAVTGKAAFEKIDVRSLKDFIQIEKSPVPKNNLRGIRDYEKQFLSLI